jgi:hypothetical protein
MQIDTPVALSQFVGTLPTFIAVILAWMHSNFRIGDLQRSLDKPIDDMRQTMTELIKSESALIRAEMRRMEKVMDTRLKHLEENR